MVSITVVMMLVMQLFGRNITALFVAEPEVIELGALGLRINSMFYVTLGMIYVVRGVLTGVGDAFFALFNGIVEVIGRFTIPILMTGYMGFGETGIWISTGAVWALSAAGALFRYYTHLNVKTGIMAEGLKNLDHDLEMAASKLIDAPMVQSYKTQGTRC